MPDNTTRDSILFDRLVDGELSMAERRDLLQSLDQRPEGWRRCALAFLEAQSWRGEFGQLLGDVVHPSTQAANLVVRDAHNRKRLHSAAAWLAVAASVFVAFGLGTMQRADQHTIGTIPSSPIDQAVVSQSPAPRALPDSKNAEDVMTLWVRDETGDMRPMRVPLVDAGALDRELGMEFQSAVPVGMRERLQQRGYDVQSKRRYAPLWLENGRPMILPVEDTKIVPVGQNI